MHVREATPQDSPLLCELITRIPISAGSAFSVDRSPDFFALLRQRGNSRTFVVIDDDREALGLVTALWHCARVAQGEVVVGEIVDLRVAPKARGTRAASLLLQSAVDALNLASADWITCLVGDRNADARRIIERTAPESRLLPLTRYASVHYPAWRLFPKPQRVTGVNDPIPGQAILSTLGPDVPELAPLAWPLWQADDTRIWAAPADTPRATMVVSDLHEVRRIRVDRYAPADWPLVAGSALVSLLGLGQRLPKPGGVLRLWATRWVGGPTADRTLVRALVRTALAEAARAGVHVLQVNVPERSHILELLPRGPRSIFWSTLYGRPTAGEAQDTWSPNSEHTYHADVALI